MKKILFLFLVCCGPLLGQQSSETVPGEPANLGVAKLQLRHYYTCSEADCYGPQMTRQTDLAMRYLREIVAAAKPGEKLALVLDIDETALSNWQVEAHDDFGYIPTDFNWFIALRRCTAIEGTLRLFQEAEKDNVAVFFITGRPESQREDTAANLKAVGYDRWERLYLRPDVHPKDETTATYKSGDRREIAAEGYRLVLNVGDQLSDLEGSPVAEHSVKLPNPFYFIP